VYLSTRKNDPHSRGHRKRFQTFCKELKKYETVLYVKGNHDNYGIYEDATPLLRGLFKKHAPNTILLDNETIDIEGVRFIGSTLWTTYGCNGPNHVSIQRSFPDFHEIKTTVPLHEDEDIYFHTDRFRNITVFDVYNWHQNDIQFVKGELEASPLPCVVITHHPPSFLLGDPIYYSDPWLEAFASNQHYLIETYKPKYWLYGHNHYPQRLMIGETMCVTNPRGYSGHERLAKFFNPNAADLDIDDIIC
jgi:hypothetical protein